VCSLDETILAPAPARRARSSGKMSTDAEAGMKRPTSEWLLVTSEPALLRQVKTVLGQTGAQLEYRRDAASAMELASRRHLDGFVIDCDDLPEGTATLAAIRDRRPNRQALIVAVTSQATSEKTALELGADFVVFKPVQEAQLRHCFALALPQAERDHRRYCRHKVTLPMELRDHEGHCYKAKVLNVSEEGLAVTLTTPTILSGIVSVAFDLPSAGSHRFCGKATVTRCHPSGTGLRFVHIEPDTRARFQAWLDSLV